MANEIEEMACISCDGEGHGAPPDYPRCLLCDGHGDYSQEKPSKHHQVIENTNGRDWTIDFYYIEEADEFIALRERQLQAALATIADLRARLEWPDDRVEFLENECVLGKATIADLRRQLEEAKLAVRCIRCAWCGWLSEPIENQDERWSSWRAHRKECSSLMKGLVDEEYRGYWEYLKRKADTAETAEAKGFAEGIRKAAEVARSLDVTHFNSGGIRVLTDQFYVAEVILSLLPKPAAEGGAE